MPLPDPAFQSALNDFHQARQRAVFQEFLARLRGRSNQLLSYDEVARQLKLSGRAERGVQTIPIAAIVGSVGRYTDFTRTFLPRRSNDQARWAAVKAALESPTGVGLPPIDVYKVGEVYFVLDGNHRVSIARQTGITHIDAHVIEIRTRVPLTPDIQPDDLIIKAEYAEFLDQTRLAELRPHADLSVTVPGQYEKLLEHIAVHRYYLSEAQPREVPYEAAVADWYDEVYWPSIALLRERGLLRWFPGRTEADLYLFAAEHRQTLEQELGWDIRPDAAVLDLAARENARVADQEATPGSWRTARLLDRYTDHLFADILVPLSGSPDSWRACEQALLIAQREDAQLHGLHVVKEAEAIDRPEVPEIRARFKQVCEAANVKGSLVVESGDVARKIIERALLTDLVVLNVAHPPSAGLASLGHGLRSIIWRCARPILAVPDTRATFQHALLAYDGSPKSKEALFIAAYLAERWQTQLTVLSSTDSNRVTANVHDYPRAYLELHEIQAEFILLNEAIGALLRIAQERHADAILMGGYSVSALEEVVVGSAVNALLRESHIPLFLGR